MSEKFSLTKTIKLEAPVTKVWQALTDPTLIKEYFFGVDVSSDWKEGSPLYYKGNWQGKPLESKGKILRLEAEKTFRHSYWSNLSGMPDIPENYHIVSYQLSEVNVGSLLQLTEENLQSEAMKQQSDKIWDIVFNNLKKLVEQ